MKTLVIVGDSHSAGSEIEDKPDNQICIEKAWGAHLSKKLNYNYVNLASPGASNWLIARNAQDWIYNNVIKEDKVALEDITMIIMWSSFHRHEIIYPDTKAHRVIGPGTKIKGYYKTDHDDELEQLQKLQILFNDPAQTQYENLYHVYNLKRYLDSVGINYKFINGIQHFLKPEGLAQKNWFRYSYTTLFEQMDWSEEYIGALHRPDTYFFYFKDVIQAKFDPWVKSMHFNEAVHKKWADILYDRFKDSL